MLTICFEIWWGGVVFAFLFWNYFYLVCKKKQFEEVYVIGFFFDLLSLLRDRKSVV